MKRFICFLNVCVICMMTCAQTNDDHAVVRSNRADGRFQSTYGIVHELLKDTHPRLAYKPGMTKTEFAKWQDDVRAAMEEIMNFPEVKDQPAPLCINREERDGYILEKWEFYPLPKAVSTFLVLRPKNLQKPVPAVLCIPGSGRTKEGLAGEPGTCKLFSENYQDPKVAMAKGMVQQGYIAVAVDNAAAGEASDLEYLSNGNYYDYDTPSRFLLEMGWSWLGYTAFLDMQVLQWMKCQSDIRKDRIVVSGFSLGTEPMMVLGALDKSIYAFVYNDFLCQTQERAVVMTKPNERDRRPFPNTIRHLIPNYWKYFNFPDVVASFAPRPIIFTEGGLDRDFRKVQSAYRDAGKPDNVRFYHYPKFADKANRHDVEQLEEGYDAAHYFNDVNVDPPSHYFKHELILPWLNKLLSAPEKAAK